MFNLKFAIEKLPKILHFTRPALNLVCLIALNCLQCLQTCCIYFSMKTYPSGVIIPFISPKLSYLFSIFLFFIAPSSFILRLVIFFCYSIYIFIYLVPYFNFAPHHHLHHIIVFYLCPLEVNLHTYLTTWLSSCPVGIFFGFLTIFYLK